MSALFQAANVRAPIRDSVSADSTVLPIAVTTTADNTLLPAAWGLKDGAQYVQLTAEGGDIAVLFLRADETEVDYAATSAGPTVGDLIKDGVTRHYLVPQGYLYLSHDGSASCVLRVQLA